MIFSTLGKREKHSRIFYEFEILMNHRLRRKHEKGKRIMKEHRTGRSSSCI